MPSLCVPEGSLRLEERGSAESRSNIDEEKNEAANMQIKKEEPIWITAI